LGHQSKATACLASGIEARSDVPPAGGTARGGLRKIFQVEKFICRRFLLGAQRTKQKQPKKQGCFWLEKIYY